MISLVILSILYLSGCANSDSDSDSNDRLLVPSSEIQHLQIVQDNGNVPPGMDRFIDYSYSRNELPIDVLQKLDEISTATEDLYCSNDGMTYEINITDSLGEIFTYVSNNRDCGRENEIVFIAVDEIEHILSMLE
jgi:outer membrane murein-binding lipoprotein Lpp